TPTHCGSCDETQPSERNPFSQFAPTFSIRSKLRGIRPKRMKEKRFELSEAPADNTFFGLEIVYDVPV
ncbi:hypothetical protein, partial [Abditibacterium utsteinense]|uniref:hypothetical protein n=1 Tax=Abditibacterium utsteinense TaxID=1960156 RepID=UPI001EE6D298